MNSMNLRSKFRAAAGAITVFWVVLIAVFTCLFMMTSCNPSSSEPCTNCNNSEQTETTVTDTTQAAETTNTTTISPTN